MCRRNSVRNAGGRTQSLFSDLTLISIQILDSQEDATESSHRILRYLMLKFATECQTVPSSLYIRGLQFSITGDHVQGGFSDVYRSSLNNEDVAVKRLRVPLNENSEFDKVSAFFDVSRPHPHIFSSDATKRGAFVEADEASSYPSFSWSRQGRPALSEYLYGVGLDAWRESRLVAQRGA